jgi:hypothetical protein
MCHSAGWNVLSSLTVCPFHSIHTVSLSNLLSATSDVSCVLFKLSAMSIDALVFRNVTPCGLAHRAKH